MAGVEGAASLPPGPLPARAGEPPKPAGELGLRRGLGPMGLFPFGHDTSGS